MNNKDMEEEVIDVQEQSMIENVENSVLVDVVSSKLGYEFTQMILVKPLDVEKVFKTLTVPEPSGEKDEEGEDIMQMTIKQVETESLLRKGVVLAIPTSLSAVDGKVAGMQVSVGDIVVYPNKRSIDFDLFKDSQLVPSYEVLAKVI